VVTQTPAGADIRGLRVVVFYFLFQPWLPASASDAPMFVSPEGGTGDFSSGAGCTFRWKGRAIFLHHLKPGTKEAGRQGGREGGREGKDFLASRPNAQKNAQKKKLSASRWVRDDGPFSGTAVVFVSEQALDVISVAEVTATTRPQPGIKEMAAGPGGGGRGDRDIFIFSNFISPTLRSWDGQP
jgi:hypothetical protein